MTIQSLTSALRLEGRFLFLLLTALLVLPAFLCAADPGLSGGEAAVEGWSEDREVTVRGDRVEYFQDEERMEAEGTDEAHVLVESGATRLWARQVWLDMKTGLLRAEGGVVWAESGNTIFAQRLELDMKGERGKAQQLLFTRDAWSATGQEAEKPDKDSVSLRGCEVSSCAREQPHWRLGARELRVRFGDRLWAKGVIVYVGRAPLFYLPRYSQSLRDGRPPFEIKPGYTKTLGPYVRTAYNYFFDEEQYGTIRLDWMDKKGVGSGLSHHYQFGKGIGEIGGYYVRDKRDRSADSWSLDYKHAQDLGQGRRLMGDVGLLSSFDVNERYDLNRSDAFQRRSRLTLQSSQKDYAWNLQASERQLLQIVPPSPGSLAEPTREYVTVERQMPEFRYDRFSRPLWDGVPLYWSLGGGGGRRLVTPQVLVGQGLTLYDTRNAYYSNSVNIAPTLTHSLRLGRRDSLTSKGDLTETWARDDGEEGTGRANTMLGTGFTWSHRYSRWLNSELGHRYSRQVTGIESLRWAGELLNLAELRLRADLGATWSVDLFESYDIRPYQVDSDLRRLGLARAQVTFSPTEHRGADLSLGWHPTTSQVKTVDLNGRVNDPAKRWQLGLGASWVNNRLVLTPSPFDPNAPAFLERVEPRVNLDQLLLSARATLAVTTNWKVSAYDRFNASSPRLEEQAFSVWRSLHCWDLEFYARETPVGGWQYGFSLSLKALPQVRASSNQVTADLFEDAQFGY